MRIEGVVGWLSARASARRSVVADGEMKLPDRAEAAGELLFPPEALRAPRSIVLEGRVDAPIPVSNPSVALWEILSELRLIHGIGREFDRALRGAGYASIPALAEHPRWGDRARRLLDRWGSPPDPGEIHRSLAAWLPPTDPLFLRFLLLLPSDRLVFFDLETLGLGNAPVFLAAIARPEADGRLSVRQYFAPSLAAEAELLDRVTDEMQSAAAVVSYNGKAFDAMILRERLAYYGRPAVAPLPHVDLLHHVRRRFRGRLPDCRLSTVEDRVLALPRADDLPSALVPEYYAAFLESGDPRWIAPILNHNRRDIVTLPALLSALIASAHDR